MKIKSKNQIVLILIFIGFFISTNSISATTVTKTLYSWAKDAAGNISNTQSSSIDVTIPV